MISSTNTSLKFQFTWYKYYYLTFSYVKLKGALKQLKNFFIGIFINDNPNRKEFDNFLEKFSQDQQDFKISKKKGSILIDGMWDNAGHWTRYLLVRKAINIYDLDEICLLGRWNKIKSKRSSVSFGIKNFLTFEPHKINKDILLKAFKLKRDFKKPEDIIDFEWPNKVPGSLIYDHLLLAQKKPIVDLTDKNFCIHLAIILNSFENANKLFKNQRIKIIFLSHIFPAPYLALISEALKFKVQVLVSYNSWGTLRLMKMKTIDDYKLYAQLPNKVDWEKNFNNSFFFNAGRKYLSQRLNGRGKDLGSQLTFSKIKGLTKKQLKKRFNWNENKPIIAIYPSQWFDTPHAHGMTNYRDVFDWFVLTLNTIKKNKNAYWLIKPHPVEVWYGGLRLSEYFKKNETKHVKIYDKKINNFDFLKIIDGAVTIHGTISFELSYLGKPVLCSDKSSYTEFNFTINSKSRVDYVKKIESNWWDNFDKKKSYYKSCLTAGWVYGVPDWQKSLIFPDDVHKDDNCKNIMKILKNNSKEVNKEISYIRKWYKSSEKLYNVFKLKNSKKVVDLISSQLVRNN